MSSYFSKRMKKGWRRNRRDGKHHAITDAGIRLLARKDFEAFSMAQLAREAGCSVGALYARFRDKNSYLYHAVAAGFRSMSDAARSELEGSRWRQLSAASRVKLIVEHTVSKMANPRAAGIIRATVKLATINPHAMDLFEDYRKVVSDQAVNLLAGKVPGSAGAVRIAMQIVLATVTDAILQRRPGPMSAGSARMTSALTNVVSGYLGLSKAGRWSGREVDGEDKPADDEFSDSPTKADQDGVFDPDLRVVRYRKSPLASKRRRKKAPSRASIPVKPEIRAQIPPKVPTAEPNEKPKPLRRKHRFI
jgi:AcrR family transcriptional regulator